MWIRRVEYNFKIEVIRELRQPTKLDKITSEVDWIQIGDMDVEHADSSGYYIHPYSEKTHGQTIYIVAEKQLHTTELGRELLKYIRDFKLQKFKRVENDINIGECIEYLISTL
jgi:hypothetical protein